MMRRLPRVAKSTRTEPHRAPPRLPRRLCEMQPCPNCLCRSMPDVLGALAVDWHPSDGGEYHE
jgi:hypothetical protein